MGFFLSDEEIEKPKVVTQKKTVKKLERKQIISGGTGCDNCTLKQTWGTIVTPKMPMYGKRRDAEILVLGEAPGQHEDEQGIPFVGQSGKLLREHLRSIDMPLIAFQNAVRCRPPDNRNPSLQELHACGQYLEEDIAELPNLKVILGVGGIPLTRLFPTWTNILKVHGVPFPIQIKDRVFWYYPVMHPSFVLHMKADNGGHGPVKPVFVNDLKRFFREWQTWPKPKIISLDPNKVIVPSSREEAISLIEGMKGPHAVDIETAVPVKDLVPKPYHSGARLLTAAISDGETAISFAVNHPQHQNSWGIDVLLDCVERFHWVAHNVQYELIWLIYEKQRLGRDKPLAIFDDTMALGRLYHERESIQSLADMSQIHLGTNVKTVINVDASDDMLKYSLDEVYRYNALDVLATAQIYQKLIKKVNKQNYERILATQESTARMDVMGLPIDAEVSRQLRTEWQQKADHATNEAKTIYEVKEFERTYQKEFNIGSGDQVATALVQFGKVDLPQTKGKKKEGGRSTGKISTDDASLKKFAGDNPLAKCVLDFREAKINVSTFIDSVANNVSITSDNLFHPGYTVTHTTTGRLSSSPQIQNWPKRRHREIRRQIPAPPGHVFAAFDYGQLEARVYAMVSRDPVLCKSILTDHDIHYDWLDKTLGYYPEYLDVLIKRYNLEGAEEKKIRKKGRDVIKGDFVFAAFFGSGAFNIAERTGMPRKKAEQILEELWDTFPVAKEWIKSQRQEYENTGSVRTLTGRVRYGILWGNEPLNTPVQGTGADIALDALNEFVLMSKELDDKYFHPRLMVHDDISFILPDNNDLPLYIETIQEVLVKVRYDWQIVPLTAECQIGPNWCDLEEVDVFKGDYVR